MKNTISQPMNKEQQLTNKEKFNKIATKFYNYIQLSTVGIDGFIDNIKDSIHSGIQTGPTKEDVKTLRENALKIIQPSDNQLRLLRFKLSDCDDALKLKLLTKISFEGLSLLSFDKLIWMIDNKDNLTKPSPKTELTTKITTKQKTHVL